MPAVSSAAGLLALLDEPSNDLKRHALVNLDKVVHDYWFQISGSIGSVEALYEDDQFTHRDLAALVASKVGALSSCAHGRQDAGHEISASEIISGHLHIFVSGSGSSLIRRLFQTQIKPPFTFETPE